MRDRAKGTVSGLTLAETFFRRRANMCVPGAYKDELDQMAGACRSAVIMLMDKADTVGSTSEEQRREGERMMTREARMELHNTLIYLADCLLAVDMLSRMHSCNDCGNVRACAYAPTWGEEVRYNCPLWAQPKRPDNGGPNA